MYRTIILVPIIKEWSNVHDVHHGVVCDFCSLIRRMTALEETGCDEVGSSSHLLSPQHTSWRGHSTRWLPCATTVKCRALGKAWQWETLSHPAAFNTRSCATPPQTVSLGRHFNLALQRRRPSQISVSSSDSSAFSLTLVFENKMNNHESSL